jgi:hypothetical protein
MPQPPGYEPYMLIYVIRFHYNDFFGGHYGVHVHRSLDLHNQMLTSLRSQPNVDSVVDFGRQKWLNSASFIIPALEQLGIYQNWTNSPV